MYMTWILVRTVSCGHHLLLPIMTPLLGVETMSQIAEIISALHWSGQIIATSAEVTPNGGLVRESRKNALNSGLGIIVICPGWWIVMKHGFKRKAWMYNGLQTMMITKPIWNGYLPNKRQHFATSISSRAYMWGGCGYCDISQFHMACCWLFCDVQFQTTKPYNKDASIIKKKQLCYKYAPVINNILQLLMILFDLSSANALWMYSICFPRKKTWWKPMFSTFRATRSYCLGEKSRPRSCESTWITAAQVGER